MTRPSLTTLILILFALLISAPFLISNAQEVCTDSAGSPTCNGSGRGACHDTSCKRHSVVCQIHGVECRFGCTKREHYSYGVAPQCPPAGQGPCQMHGMGPCPQPGQGFGPAFRQAFAPTQTPYFGMRPLVVPPGYYQPGYEPRFPRVYNMMCPPSPRYLTTTPPEQIKTYTTRGPRDFLNPNPPSIGY
ncbi:MAG: hypothetical protein ACRCUY_10290 [Thermoguttaceae bacterium]